MFNSTSKNSLHPGPVSIKSRICRLCPRPLQFGHGYRRFHRCYAHFNREEIQWICGNTRNGHEYKRNHTYELDSELDDLDWKCWQVRKGSRSGHTNASSIWESRWKEDAALRSHRLFQGTKTLTKQSQGAQRYMNAGTLSTSQLRRWTPRLELLPWTTKAAGCWTNCLHPPSREYF